MLRDFCCLPRRYEKQLEQEEASFQQQRRRLYQDVQDEKERIAEQAKKQRQELDRLQHQMEENNRKALSTLREEYEKARDEQERRHMVRKEGRMDGEENMVGSVERDE